MFISDTVILHCSYFKAALRAPEDCIRIGNVNVKVMVGELSKVKVWYDTNTYN